MEKEKKYADRKRFFNLDLSKWYMYKEKNERASFNISFGEYNSILWINERNINEVTKECRDMVFIDNINLYQIAYLMKESMKTMKDSDFIKIDILTVEKGVSGKQLKITFKFGKEPNGYYLGVITPGKQGIKFYLIPSERFSEVKAYENSQTIIKNRITEAFAIFWLNGIMELTKDFLLGKGQDMSVKVGKTKPVTSSTTSDLSGDINEFEEIKEVEPIEDSKGDMTMFMDEMGSSNTELENVGDMGMDLDNMEDTL